MLGMCSLSEILKKNAGSDDSGAENFIYGRNAVMEALKAERGIDTLFVAKGERTGSVSEILKLAKERGILIKETQPAKLSELSNGGKHQGVGAFCAVYDYFELSDVLSDAKAKGEPSFLVICDGIEDPHNLGAILRTAEGAGVHGVVISKRRCVSVTPAVLKASAGAAQYVKVARVTNLASTIDSLKKENIWVFGAAANGGSYLKTNFSGGVALVIGSEGFGISKLVSEKCDALVSIPMRGKIGSLNASVAAGVLMYAVAAKRDV
jgi:23S rRNA (guanosine2251-2'-O)-methyltransferase